MCSISQVVLICISLIFKDTELLFIYLSLWNVYLSHCPFKKLDYLLFYYLVPGVLYVFQIQILCQIHFVDISCSLWLKQRFFCFVVFCSAENGAWGLVHARKASTPRPKQKYWFWWNLIYWFFYFCGYYPPCSKKPSPVPNLQGYSSLFSSRKCSAFVWSILN